MTLNQQNTNNIKIYIKQYLNKLYEVDKLIKLITNDNTNEPIWLSQCNNVNVKNLLWDLANNSCLRHEQESNEYGEKHI